MTKTRKQTQTQWSNGGFSAMARAMLAADEAEERGDAAGALRIIADAGDGTDGERFWRPERVLRLRQLSELEPWLPGWVWSRWLLAQAAQWLDPRGKGRVRRAVAMAQSVRGTLGPDDPVRVVDTDWVFRQVLLYELGALRSFVARPTVSELVGRADHIEDWSRAPMRGLRLVECGSVTLRWVDLASGEAVVTTNLGAAGFVDDDECVIGRVVPIVGGTMFETAPLWVPGDVARSVADDPAGWVRHLREANEVRAPGGRPPVPTSGQHDFGLLTDVPRGVWQGALLAYGGLAGLAEELGMDAWACIAAWVLDPATVEHLSQPPLPPSVRSALEGLAPMLAEPAAGVLRHIVDLDREAA